MATTRRNLIAATLATAVAPTLAIVAPASAAADPIFPAREVHRVAWHRVDDACTKVSALESSPHTTTMAALKAAEAERDAIGDKEEWPAYVALVPTRPTTAAGVLALVRHMREFELTERLDFNELRELFDALGRIPA